MVSYNIDWQKPKSKIKTIYEYKNADVNGLINYIKHFDFKTAVFHHPKTEQAQLYSKVLTDAFSLFFPCKTVTIRSNDQPWTNTYTRMLIRKKNRHYRFYKKVNSEYIPLLTYFFGPSGVHALPLAAGINVGGHYKWHFFLSLSFFLPAHC